MKWQTGIKIGSNKKKHNNKKKDVNSRHNQANLLTARDKNQSTKNILKSLKKNKEMNFPMSGFGLVKWRVFQCEKVSIISEPLTPFLSRHLKKGWRGRHVEWTFKRGSDIWECLMPDLIKVIFKHKGIVS